jgi:hypothetical protein
VILVDANLLLYAEYDECSQHKVAREWWDAQLSGSAPVGLPWQLCPPLFGWLQMFDHGRDRFLWRRRATRFKGGWTSRAFASLNRLISIGIHFARCCWLERREEIWFRMRTLRRWRSNMVARFVRVTRIFHGFRG